MAKASIKKFLEWATPHALRMGNVLPYEKQINPADQWGYILGWHGQVAKSGKWKGRLCMDCNGLAEFFLRLEIGGNHNTFSRVNYSTWCKGYNGTNMNAMPQVPGCAVFAADKVGFVHHVGFLWKKYGTGRRDWLVVEAANGDKGVIISKFHNGWNRWGLMMQKFDYDTAEIPFIDIPATVKLGSMGGVVKTLQKLLNAEGANPQLDMDGEFGPLTDAAVRKFQRDNKLLVDGEVGPQTWKALLT